MNEHGIYNTIMIPKNTSYETKFQVSDEPDPDFNLLQRPKKYKNHSLPFFKQIISFFTEWWFKP